MNIEFRWLDRGWDLNRGGRHTASRDLQVRVLEEVRGSDDETMLQWSKWKTVPTIKANVVPR